MPRTQKSPIEMFHAGERLGSTLMELKNTYKIEMKEVADFIDIGYPMLTRYRKMAYFSPTVMYKIKYLEEMDVRPNFKLNAKHYEQEGEPRWVPKKIGSEEITTNQLMDELERISSLVERLVELNKQVTDIVIKKVLPQDNKE